MGKITDRLRNQIKKTENIKKFLKHNKSEMNFDTLDSYLNMTIKEKGISKSRVVTVSNIEKSYVYDIFRGRKKPTRNKLLAICFAMKLTEDELMRVLTLAGVSVLYPRNPRDSIILFANHQKLNTIECNQLLYDNNEEILG